jgi:hypothetical protein
MFLDAPCEGQPSQTHENGLFYSQGFKHGFCGAGAGAAGVKCEVPAQQL